MTTPMTADELGRPRWDGRDGRLEVWYATATDPASGTGLWIHHEFLATTDGRRLTHGWVAVFPPGAPALVERFGPGDETPGTDGDWSATAEARIGPGRLQGRTDTVFWDLTTADDAAPLFTFPSYVWRRELLPSAQVVPWPTARVTGRVHVDGRTIALDGAPGQVARIHGHGNAQRWGWLHADLGDGDVLEVVAATGRRPALRALPPKVFAQLRVDGVDWPADPLVATASSSARLGLPRWWARVTTARHRLRVGVRLPPVSSVTLEYRDPDGARASCTNSCVADAEIRLERRTPTGWRTERAWSLRATAHAELGDRPPGGGHR